MQRRRPLLRRREATPLKVAVPAELSEAEVSPIGGFGLATGALEHAQSTNILIVLRTHRIPRPLFPFFST